MNRTPTRRLEISTQTLLQDIAKSWGYCIGVVSMVTANRKCSKNRKLSEKE